MKVYTRTGDNGSTSLYDGSRASKSEQIFDLLGTLDELAAHIGVFIALVNSATPVSEIPIHNTFLEKVQQILLNIGSIIATPSENKSLPVITGKDVKSIEDSIDDLDLSLHPLQTFVVMTSVSPTAAQAHVCRTVCRRSEREYFRYGNVDENIAKFLNRLSDYFFTRARYEDEVPVNTEGKGTCHIM